VMAWGTGTAREVPVKAEAASKTVKESMSKTDKRMD
jgi:hypothetical protein